MQGAFAKKKEEHKPLEAQHAPKVSPFDSSVLMPERKAPSAQPLSPSMSEGPMALRESQGVEKHGRDSFEASVRKELEVMKARLAAKLAEQKKKKGKKKSKGKEKKEDK